MFLQQSNSLANNVIISITAAAMYWLNYSGGGYIGGLCSLCKWEEVVFKLRTIAQKTYYSKRALGLEVIVFSLFSWHNQDKYQAQNYWEGC